LFLVAFHDAVHEGEGPVQRGTPFDFDFASQYDIHLVPVQSNAAGLVPIGQVEGQALGLGAATTLFHVLI